MSPRRTRRGTIRESVIETSVDSSLKDTSKITKRSRRANKSVAKASEDDSDSPMEVNSAIDSTSSANIFNETSSKVNKRRRGALETSVSQDSSLSVTIEQPKTKSRSTKNNTKTPRNTKQATTSKSQKSPSKGETSTTKAEKRVSYNLMSDNEDHSEAPSKKKAKSSRKGAKEQKQSPGRGSSKNISFDKNVTPKTSPVLNVSFTPHRSKKTPRKSPISLGSPKTHSPSPVKFTIVPRKLEIVDSPSSSESSLQQNNSLNAANDSMKNTSKSEKSSKSKLNVSSSKKITPFKPRPTFSKSPKIVLKTPKSKSSKKANSSAGSAKLKKTSAAKQKKSPVKSSKAAKSNKPAKNESLSVSADISGIIDFDETVTSKTSLDLSVNTSVKSSAKSPKAASSAKSKLDLLSSSLKSIPKVILSSVSTKTPFKSKPASPSKSKGSPKKGSPVKTVASPNAKLALVSKGTPKIVLSRKSPVKSVKKTSPTKPNVTFPSKAAQSPPKAKSHASNTSQESLESVASPSKTKVKSTSKSTPASGSPKKSNKTSSTSSRSSLNNTSLKTPTKSSRSSLNTSSRKTPTKSSQSSLNTSSRKTPNTSLSTGLSPKKMPKIVLTLKSKKSPSKSTKFSTPLSAKKSPKATAPETPKVLVKSPRSSPVSKALKVPIKRQSRKSSPTKNTSKNATLSPKVVVSKLSSPDLKNNSLRAKENQPSVALVAVDHETRKSTGSPRKSPTKSPKPAATRKSSSPVKSPKSVVKKPLVGRISSKPNTPSSSVKTPKSVVKKSLVGRISSKPNTPSSVVTNKLLKLKPTSTSTPREKGKPTRSPLGKSKIIKRLNNQSTLQINQPLLADESEPFLDNSSLIRMSDVFDVDSPRKNNTFDKNSSKTKSPKAAQTVNKSDTFEVEKSPKNSSRRSNRSGTFEVTKASPNASGKNKSKKNNTYEVNEPKTPSLQSKSMKRTVNQAELDGEPSTKKSRKVNFASPARDNARASSMNRIGTPAHPKNQRKTPVSVSVTKTPVEARSRINSGLGNKTPLCTPLNKRRSSSIADPTNTRRSNYDAQLASVNRLSRPKAVLDSQKKLETKTPVGRKIPNFAEIHQKRFAKMESLVDLKKRVEKRHVVMNANSAKKAATDSTNGAYNRFGFKVRKDEAINLISKKQAASADSREKKRDTARSALQGVRMNRRFELQMKARTKTS